MTNTDQPHKPPGPMRQDPGHCEPEAEIDLLDLLLVLLKQKKLIAEFKDATDADQLYQILRSIRAGEPVVSQIEEARTKLQEQ